ncbi:MAG: transposase [Geminicoccaceae bacterium]
MTLPWLGGRPGKFGLFEPKQKRGVGERIRRRFTAEYKAESVKFYQENGPSHQSVAEEFGVHAI